MDGCYLMFEESILERGNMFCRILIKASSNAIFLCAGQHLLQLFEAALLCKIDCPRCVLSLHTTQLPAVITHATCSWPRHTVRSIMTLRSVFLNSTPATYQKCWSSEFRKSTWLLPASTLRKRVTGILALLSEWRHPAQLAGRVGSFGSQQHFSLSPLTFMIQSNLVLF